MSTSNNPQPGGPNKGPSGKPGVNIEMQNKNQVKSDDLFGNSAPVNNAAIPIAPPADNEKLNNSNDAFENKFLDPKKQPPPT